MLVNTRMTTKMNLSILILFYICTCCFSFLSTRSQSLHNKLIKKHIQKMSTEISNDVTASAKDLTGYGMICTFTGLGVENMTCIIEFKKNSEVYFSGGIESLKPGTWRVIKYNDGLEEVEVIHPILPEHMFFLDLWENTILWRGKLDLMNKKIINGEIIANKKRFGFIPYKDTVATFEANLYLPKEKLPVFNIPRFSDQSFFPPADFNDPRDMKKYPRK